MDALITIDVVVIVPLYVWVCGALGASVGSFCLLCACRLQLKTQVTDNACL